MTTPDTLEAVLRQYRIGPSCRHEIKKCIDAAVTKALEKAWAIVSPHLEGYVNRDAVADEVRALKPQEPADA